ncbi:MAG: hypothetical protein AAFX90_19565 [Pseudomonadota bacterium]
MEVALGKNRSWVAPLAFVVFGGIVIGAIFSFLQVENLLVGKRGAALVAWLTLIMTGCGFAAALTALFIALRQMQIGTAQTNIAKSKVLDDRLEAMKGALTLLGEIHNCLNHIEELARRPVFGLQFAGDFGEDFTIDFRDRIISLERELKTSYRKDNYNDVYANSGQYYDLYNAVENCFRWYKYSFNNGGRLRDSNSTEFIIENTRKYVKCRTHVSAHCKERRIKIERQLREIAPNEFP